MRALPRTRYGRIFQEKNEKGHRVPAAVRNILNISIDYLC